MKQQSILFKTLLFILLAWQVLLTSGCNKVSDQEKQIYQAIFNGIYSDESFQNIYLLNGEELLVINNDTLFSDDRFRLFSCGELERLEFIDFLDKGVGAQSYLIDYDVKNAKVQGKTDKRIVMQREESGSFLYCGTPVNKISSALELSIDDLRMFQPQFDEVRKQKAKAAHSYKFKKNEDGDSVWTCSGCKDSYTVKIQLSTVNEWINDVKDDIDADIFFQQKRVLEDEKGWKTYQYEVTTYLQTGGINTITVIIKADSQERIHFCSADFWDNHDINEMMECVEFLSVLKNVDGIKTGYSDLWKEYWEKHCDNLGEKVTIRINKFILTSTYATFGGNRLYSLYFTADES